MRATFKRDTIVQGRTYSGSVEVESDLDTGFEVTLPAAKTGTLSTRTDNNTGTLTMAGGHVSSLVILLTCIGQTRTVLNTVNEQLQLVQYLVTVFLLI